MGGRLTVSVAFTVAGEPVAKARARFSRGKKTGAVRTYTPAKTKAFELQVSIVASSAMRSRKPFTSPIRVEVDIDLSPPSSWSAKRQAEAIGGEIRATKKPDASNVVKAVEDAMNGIVFGDDAQIVELVVRKHYAAAAGVRVLVTGVHGRSAP